MFQKSFSIAKIIGFLLMGALVLYACSKGDSGGTSNPCAGVNIIVTGTVTDADAGSNNGTIAASATGGSGTITYSIDGGAFQSSGTFNNLAKGNHTVTAKDSKGCSGSNTFAVGEKNVCAGVTITVNATATNSDPCAPAGVVTVTATGSTGFTYSLGTGAFQASGTFNNIAVGTHTVTAKDAAGCTKSASVTVNPLPAGPSFTAAKGVIQTNCAISGCHTGGSPAGGINFSVDCNIVLNKDRIKARAIDGMPSFMPPTGQLPQADKDKITAWLNAGGRFTD
jgi:hypothetical protein